MASIVVSGDTSGAITLSAPAVAGTNTITFPASTGTIITTASSGKVIPSAALPAGTVLQVVQATTTTTTSTTSSTYVAITNLTASITPTSSTNKILIIVNVSIYGQSSSTEGAITIYRNGADLSTGTGFADMYAGSSDFIMQAPMLYLDSPATTSSTTYAAYMKKTQGASNLQANFRNTTSTIILMEIAA